MQMKINILIPILKTTHSRLGGKIEVIQEFLLKDFGRKLVKTTSIFGLKHFAEIALAWLGGWRK
jgi:hypothetical protein